eukprot:13405440-Alexandrium_andersonii.AAC.1
MAATAPSHTRAVDEQAGDQGPWHCLRAEQLVHSLLDERVRPETHPRPQGGAAQQSTRSPRQQAEPTSKQRSQRRASPCCSDRPPRDRSHSSERAKATLRSCPSTLVKAATTVWNHDVGKRASPSRARRTHRRCDAAHCCSEVRPLRSAQYQQKLPWSALHLCIPRSAKDE